MNSELVEIDCINCDGDGWVLGQDNNLPIQETCFMCDGRKKLRVEKSFAEYYLKSAGDNDVE